MIDWFIATCSIVGKEQRLIGLLALDLQKGAPQGSVFGPILFNIYLNNILYFLDCNVSNIADDTTLQQKPRFCSRTTRIAIQYCFKVVWRIWKWIPVHVNPSSWLINTNIRRLI